MWMSNATCAHGKLEAAEWVQDGWTALLWGAREGHGGVVGELMAAGTNLNIQDKVSFCKRRVGYGQAHTRHTCVLPTPAGPTSSVIAVHSKPSRLDELGSRDTNNHTRF